MPRLSALLSTAVLALALSSGLAVAKKKKDEAQIQACIQTFERDPSKADRVCKPAFQIMEEDVGLSLKDQDLLKECKAMADRDFTMGEADIAKYEACTRVMNLYLQKKMMMN